MRAVPRAEFLQGEGGYVRMESQQGFRNMMEKKGFIENLRSCQRAGRSRQGGCLGNFGKKEFHGQGSRAEY